MLSTKEPTVTDVFRIAEAHGLKRSDLMGAYEMHVKAERGRPLSPPRGHLLRRVVSFPSGRAYCSGLVFVKQGLSHVDIVATGTEQSGLTFFVPDGDASAV